MTEEPQDEYFEEAYSIDDVLDHTDAWLGGVDEKLGTAIDAMTGQDIAASKIFLALPIMFPSQIWSDIVMREIDIAMENGRDRDKMRSALRRAFQGTGDQLMDMSAEERSTCALDFSKAEHHDISYSGTLHALAGFQTLRDSLQDKGMAVTPYLVRLTDDFSSIGFKVETVDGSPLITKLIAADIDYPGQGLN